MECTWAMISSTWKRTQSLLLYAHWNISPSTANSTTPPTATYSHDERKILLGKPARMRAIIPAWSESRGHYVNDSGLMKNTENTALGAERSSAPKAVFSGA